MALLSGIQLVVLIIGLFFLFLVFLIVIIPLVKSVLSTNNFTEDEMKIIDEVQKNPDLIDSHYELVQRFYQQVIRQFPRFLPSPWTVLRTQFENHEMNHEDSEY